MPYFYKCHSKMDVLSGGKSGDSMGLQRSVVERAPCWTCGNLLHESTTFGGHILIKKLKGWHYNAKPAKPQQHYLQRQLITHGNTQLHHAWQRVHIDYREWNKIKSLAMVHVLRKLSEAKNESLATAHKITSVQYLNEIFCYTWISKSTCLQLWTLLCIIRVIEKYLPQNSIIHYKSLPYHSASNELAESKVKMLRASEKRICQTPRVKSVAFCQVQVQRIWSSLTSLNVFERVKKHLQSALFATCDLHVDNAVLIRGLQPERQDIMTGWNGNCNIW